jgi:nonribosomal peptide synthetase DhbF
MTGAPPEIFLPLPIDRSPGDAYRPGRWIRLVKDDSATASPVEWTATFLAFLQARTGQTDLTLTGLYRTDYRTPVPLHRFQVTGSADPAGLVARTADLLAAPAQARMGTAPRACLPGRPERGVIASIACPPGAHAIAEADIGLLIDRHGCSLFASADLWQPETVGQMADELANLHAGQQWRSVVSLFAAQAARTPQAVAVEQDGVALSYAELDRSSSQIAAALLADGVRPEDIVVLHLRSSPGLVAAMLGSLKAGAAFLPLDNKSPAERLADIVRSSGARVLLADRALDPALASGVGGCRVRRLDNLPARPRSAPVARGTHAQGIACVFYTSGTTGGPKGVMFTQRELADFTAAMAGAFGLSPADRVLQLAPIGFDVVLEEVLPALLSGATVVIPPEPLLESGADLTRYVAEHRITGFELTAPYWQEWVAQLVREQQAIPESVRFVAMGGERVLPGTVSAWRRFGVPLVHVYGLTEATCTSTYHRMEPGVDDGMATPPLGRALPGVRVRLLDARMSPVPEGGIGEMLIEGGLARGYLSRPAATAVRFVPSPDGPPGSRLYRTGDLARRAGSAGLEYAGRADQQVKLRGFRVELDEVQARIAAHPAVAQCLAMVREDRPGDKRLVAYIVSDQGSPSPSAAELRAYVAEALPGYMVPSAFVAVQSLPLTPNGKFDRRALPPPEWHRSGTCGTSAEIAVSDLEEAVRRLFAEILGVATVGLDEGFFDLGGHSLLAIKLLSRLRGDLGVELALRAMLQEPTVAGLCRLIALNRSSHDDFEVVLPLGESRTGSPLICVHPVTGLAWCYAGLARNLDIPVLGLQARGIGEPTRLPATFEDLVGDYLAEVRARQPHGPYQLLGWSLGGNIAQALASRLRRQGEEVALLTLLDSYPAHTWEDTRLPGARPEDEQDVLIAVLREFGVEVAAPAAAGADELMAAARASFRDDSPLDEGLLVAIAKAAVRNVRLVRQARPPVFDGRVLFFTAARSSLGGLRSASLWRRYLTGPIEDHLLQCDHEGIVAAEHLTYIADVVRARLAGALAHP